MMSLVFVNKKKFIHISNCLNSFFLARMNWNFFHLLQSNGVIRGDHFFVQTETPRLLPLNPHRGILSTTFLYLTSRRLFNSRVEVSPWIKSTKFSTCLKIAPHALNALSFWGPTNDLSQMVKYWCEWLQIHVNYSFSLVYNFRESFM